MKSLAELQAIRDRAKQQVELRKENDGYKIVVGMATCGIAAGARPVMTAFLEEVQNKNITNVVVSQTGCVGMCRLEPMVDVINPDGEKVTYVKMDAERAGKVVAEHVLGGKPVKEYTIGYYEQHNN